VKEIGKKGKIKNIFLYPINIKVLSFSNYLEVNSFLEPVLQRRIKCCKQLQTFAKAEALVPKNLCFLIFIMILVAKNIVNLHLY